MKRKPPQNNVRRTRSTGKNLPGNFTNKTGETVQFESEKEFLALLCFDRDPLVKNFTTQPLTITFWAEGKEHTYTPDVKVTWVDGSIEIHEITILERRKKTEIKRRELAGQAYSQERGWTYVIQTEHDLPSGTEAANLLALFPFRPGCYANEQVMNTVFECLPKEQITYLETLTEKVHDTISGPIGRIRQTIAHMIWHNRLEIDMAILLLDETRFSQNAVVWLPEE